MSTEEKVITIKEIDGVLTMDSTGFSEVETLGWLLFFERQLSQSMIDKSENHHTQTKKQTNGK
jgi:hypothetical protein